jgi:hypothetical protein
LRRADHSSKESYCLCKKEYENEEEARAQQRALEPLMNEIKKEYYSQLTTYFVANGLILTAGSNE